MAGRRIEIDDVEEYLKRLVGDIPQADGRSEEWIEATAALRAVQVQKQERRDRHAKGGKGSGSTRKALEATRRTLALRLDCKIRKQNPKLTSKLSRAKAIIEKWPADTDLAVMAESTIRGFLEKVD